jgi:hypothetical protein
MTVTPAPVISLVAGREAVPLHIRVIDFRSPGSIGTILMYIPVMPVSVIAIIVTLGRHLHHNLGYGHGRHD